MGAALKQQQQTVEPAVSADLSQLHIVQLAKILYDECRSARAMAAYQEIVARQALEDMKRSMDDARWSENKRKGPAATRTNAELMRDDWRRKCTRLLLMGYMTRKALIATLVEYSKDRYRGKHGKHIEESTVARWLTVRTELAIRNDVDQLRLRGITATTYEG